MEFLGYLISQKFTGHQRMKNEKLKMKNESKPPLTFALRR